MKKLLILLLALSVSFSLWAEKTIVISGSTTVFPIAQRTAEVFMDNNPDVNITVRGGGSGVGIANIIAGKVDIADASRSIKSKELSQARSKGINPVGNVVAKDGIAVVVHPDNPVKNLTVDQLKDIYTGKIANWKQVGGPSMAIVIVSRDVASGTFEVFKEKALGGGKVKGGALLLASNKAVATTVGQTPTSIGYVGLGFLSSELKSVTINGVEPSLQNVRSGKYLLSRPLYMYTDGKPKGVVKQFIDFILSAEGQKIAGEVGYVPLR